MLKYLEYIKENKEKLPSERFITKTFKSEHGTIRYRIYDDDVVVFMGSYIDKDYRGKGIFNKMLDELLPTFKGKDVYVPISNEIIINHFLKRGFQIYDEPIRYWGKTENSVNMFLPK